VDARGGEAIIEMLHHLQREKSSIFVVEHDAEFKSQFENRVLVRRENGISRILEESDVQKEKAAPSESDNVRGLAKKKPKRTPRRKSVPRRKPVPTRRGKRAAPNRRGDSPR
jgi:energy-coupling factor transporter ATP-binding protein EcfA2